MYVIFSDVDGTIYRYGPKTLETRTIEDIKLAQARGVEFVLVTGNAHLSAILLLAKKLDVRYIITSSGATIYDSVKNYFIRNLTLENDVVLSVIEWARQYNSYILTWDNNGNIYCEDQKSQKIKPLIRHTIALSEQIKTIPRTVEEIKEIMPLNKIIIFGLPIAIENLMREFTVRGFNCLKLRNEALEVVPRDISKGEAVKFMINYFQTNFEKAMAIGDGPIDQSMLSLPLASYVLANADSETKKIAKYHTASVEQNGLGMAIIDFLYRNKLE